MFVSYTEAYMINIFGDECIICIKKCSLLNKYQITTAIFITTTTRYIYNDVVTLQSMCYIHYIYTGSIYSGQRIIRTPVFRRNKSPLK